MESEDPAAYVTWLVRGAWVSLALRAAVETGVLDVLGEPRPVGSLAALTGTDDHAVRRLVRVLRDLGLVAGEETVSLTPAGETLRDGHPSLLRELLLMQTVLPNLTAWERLADAVRSGTGTYERVNGVSPWRHLSEHPDEEASFNAAMARRAGLQVHAIRAAADAGALDLSGIGSVVDVGGGRGAMLAALLADHPTWTGSVADRPEVAADADRTFAAAGLAERARGEASDFFASVPAGADVYVLSNVLHDWDDEACVAILRTVRSAMTAASRLWIVEKVLDATRSAHESRDLHLLDLHMLVMFGARERSRAEYDALLVDAGFGTGAMAETGTDWNLVEARPA